MLLRTLLRTQPAGGRRAPRSLHPGASVFCPQVPEKAKHYGLSTVLKEPVDPAKDLVLQYDLKLANGLSCGGACECLPGAGLGLACALGCTVLMVRPPQALACTRCALPACLPVHARAPRHPMFHPLMLNAHAPPASCPLPDIKFVTADKAFTPKGLKDETPYTVMFGPDKCGDTNKVRALLLGALQLHGCCVPLQCCCAAQMHPRRPCHRRRPFGNRPCCFPPYRCT